MSSFQQKIKRHAKKQGSMANSHEKQWTETVTGETLDLSDKNFKSTVLNMFKE